MAIINRKSGMVRGRIGEEIFSSFHGRQVVRKAQLPYTARNTAEWQEVKYYLATFSSLWVALPPEIKMLWEKFAAAQGSVGEVEANDNISYIHNPIPNYPPRPSIASGKATFVGLNCKAALCGMDVPRYYPPIGFSPAPSPILEFRGFDKSTKEMVIGVQTPELGKNSKNFSDRKVCIWINATKYDTILHRYCLDIVDCPAKPTRIELRYKRVENTLKFYGYKPLVFGEIPWLNVDIAAHVVTAAGENYAPLVSAGSNILVFTLLNDSRLVDLHDLIASGRLVKLSFIKFNDYFYKKIAKMRSNEFVQINPTKKRNVVIG